MQVRDVGAMFFIVKIPGSLNGQPIMGHCLVKTQAIQFILATELDRKCQINMETLMLTDHLLAICQCFKEPSF